LDDGLAEIALEIGDSAEAILAAERARGDATEVEPGGPGLLGPADQVPDERVRQRHAKVGLSGGGGGVVVGVVAVCAAPGERQQGLRPVDVGPEEADQT